MKKIFTIIALFAASSINAQTTVELNLNHQFEGNNFVFGEVVETEFYNFKINRLQYYLSNFELTHDGGTTTSISDSYVLVNANNNTYSLNDVTSVTNVERIGFSFGVDGDKNHADPALQPANHPLNYQTPSMHWGWSGGYMFAVLEGSVDINKDGTFEKFFDFMPVADKYYTTLSLASNDAENSGKIVLNINVEVSNWVSGFNLASVGTNHGQNVNLGSFTDLEVRRVFSTDAMVNTNDITLSNSIIEINNNGTSPVINILDKSKSYTFEILDMNGKLVSTITSSNLQSIKTTDYLSKNGTYLISVKDKNNLVLQTNKIILNN